MHPFKRGVTTPKKNTSSLYNRWSRIKQCTNNPNHSSYPSQGGKGIKLCEEWDKNFNTFLLWSVRTGFNTSLKLTRKNLKEGYNPNNCFWS